MSITTSYFAVAKHVKGTKVSIARFHHPRVRGSIDEVVESFAPSAELLMDYKKGRMDWSEYKRRYMTEQREHYRHSPQDFESLLRRAEREKIVLLCYERFEGSRTKCHRMLLIDVLKKVADSKKYKVSFVEEEIYNREK